MASKSGARSKIWAALDAADATTALNNYTTAAADIATAQADATTGIANAAIAQAAVDALELKQDIVASKAANNTAVVKATAAMPDTTTSVKIVDATGATVGYAALYANANLT